MATCPKCYEYLSDHHACRRKTGRAMRTAVSVALAAVIGGFAGSVALGLMGTMLGMTGFEAVGLVAGAVGAVIVQRFTRIH